MTRLISPSSRTVLWRRAAFALAAVLVFAAGIARLEFDVEVLNLLPNDAPAVRGLSLYQQHFSNAGELVITLDGSDPVHVKEASRSLALALRAQARLVAEVRWQSPWVEHPEAMPAWAGYLWFNQPPEVFGALTNRFALDALEEKLLEARESLATSLSPLDLARLSYDPLGLLELPLDAQSGAPQFETGDSLFESKDGTFRLMTVRAAVPIEDYRECARWFEAVQGTVAAWQSHVSEADGISVGFTGRPAFVSEIAKGMERDINVSIAGTSLLIAALFYVMHRRLRPLLWLLAALALVLAGTFAAAGFALGTLNVVSGGFAAILLGLSVDYGMVLYQEHAASPNLSVREVRSRVFPAIAWSAATTGCAFLLLNFSGLPGVGQLGTLVAIGVLLSALVMAYIYLPLASRHLPRNGSHETAASSTFTCRLSTSPRGLLWLTLILITLSAALLAWKRPSIQAGSEPLRPRDSRAYAALSVLKTRMERQQEPLWILIFGETLQSVAHRLHSARELLHSEAARRSMRDFTLPAAVWPHPERQESNRAIAAFLPSRRADLQAAASRLGFSATAIAAPGVMLDFWAEAARSAEPVYPSDPIGQWAFHQFASRRPPGHFALGVIHPLPEEETEPGHLSWANVPGGDGLWITGWDLLGAVVLETVSRDLKWMLAPMLLVLCLVLRIAFGSFTEVALSLAALGCAALFLWSAMALADWSWNLINLTALPLLLGAGVDYSIHVQLSLQRHRGDLRSVRHSTGRALFLCAASTAAGFASLAWSGNAGLASLGRVCACGILISYFTAVWLLPAWWKIFVQPRALAPAG